MIALLLINLVIDGAFTVSVLVNGTVLQTDSFRVWEWVTGCGEFGTVSRQVSSVQTVQMYWVLMMTTMGRAGERPMPGGGEHDDDDDVAPVGGPGGYMTVQTVRYRRTVDGECLAAAAAAGSQCPG